MEKTGGTSKGEERASRLSSVVGGELLPKVLIANLLFLMGLAVISFSLPLSEFERWFGVSAVTILAAVNGAALEHLQTR